MKNSKFLITLAVIVLLLSSILLVKDMFKDIKYGNVLNNYNTDTITINKPYPIPRPYFIQVKPKTVTIYKVNPADGDLIRINDSLQALVDNHDTIYIKDNFLELFPYNPKLISMGLNRDSLHLTLFGINSELIQYSYPIYLNDYSYQWDEKSLLTAKPTSYLRNFGKRKLNTELNAFGGYDILKSRPELGIEAKLNLSSFFIATETSATIQNKPELQLRGKIGIRINKWQRE